MLVLAGQASSWQKLLVLLSPAGAREDSVAGAKPHLAGPPRLPAPHARPVPPACPSPARSTPETPGRAEAQLWALSLKNKSREAADGRRGRVVPPWRSPLLTPREVVGHQAAYAVALNLQLL